jgi:hypothetical protein
LIFEKKFTASVTGVLEGRSLLKLVTKLTTDRRLREKTSKKLLTILGRIGIKLSTYQPD